MLHHVVMWQLRDENRQVNLAEAVRLLRSCSAITPGILKFEVAAAQPGLACTSDLVLNSSFVDRAALSAYQAHPDHEAIKPFMKSVVAARQCMDYET
ncbi:stress responsive protein [Hydrogenophaga crassostreae]|uniref:Stress responsive protein n=1 Tax=Hydrogenophaga crassostreae TaxID=1763535 RepID=A0A162P3Z8_9BURK|nr:Dabb family protein [Hydrogenophaga crassostreae]AOW12187.1 stress responsive protein [Hydrogenophaga crassostreae]OAD41132.1 stress responsive protein [Hydrogenophaga crassostreae]